MGLVLCFSVIGCGTLNKSGVYNGDKFLYSTDLTLVTSKDVLQAFVSWEKNNRAAINNPDIKKAADSIRLGAPKWYASALAVRDAYAANPSTDNKNAVVSVLAVIQAAVTQASSYMVTVSKGVN